MRANPGESIRSIIDNKHIASGIFLIVIMLHEVRISRLNDERRRSARGKISKNHRSVRVIRFFRPDMLNPVFPVSAKKVVAQAVGPRLNDTFQLVF
jgi:hypothetical protein